jgi:fatty acid desaturase
LVHKSQEKESNHRLRFQLTDRRCFASLLPMTGFTHKDVVANLSAEDRERLLARSNRAGLIHLAGHLALLALTGTWIILALPFWQLGLIAHGIVLIFLFTLLHETTHETPFAASRLNATVGALCGFILFLPYRWFTYFHLAHHRFTQDPERDPELCEGKPQTWRQYLGYLSGLPIWRSQARQLIRNAMDTANDPFVPARRRGEVKAEARIHLALYAGLLAAGLTFRLDALVWLWLIPALIGQPFLRAYLLAEHTGCPLIANMLENTRTTYTGSLIRFIAWNMPYHTEHHTYPMVPFHNLPVLNRLMEQHLKVTENGYLSFHKKLLAKLK